MVKLRVVINDVDQTSILIQESLILDCYDGDVIDTLNIELDDQDLLVTITEGQDIILEDFDNSGSRFFGGIVVDVNLTVSGIGRIITIVASDWKMILDRSYFTAQYDDITDQVMIQNAFTEAEVTEINTVDLVQSARTLDKMVFRGTSLRQMLDAIKNITGFYWDVDKFKKLIYRPFGNNPLTFSFTESPNNTTTFPYYNIAMTKEIGQFNAIEIHGGSRLSTISNQVYTGNGTRKRFKLGLDFTISTLDYPLIFRGLEGAEPDIPKIERNTGTDGTPVWTVQTVGIEEQDTGKDVLWNPVASQVLWTVAPPNFATNAWRISGRGLVRAAFLSRDEDAILQSGRVFLKVLTLEEVEDDDQAIDVANAFLREQGPKTYVEFNFQKDGVVVGDSLAITNTPLGLTAEQLQVHQLSMRLMGGEVYEYRVVLRNTP